METIKSYTDLEQSKKLAEILPLESADMYYFLDPTPAGNIYHIVIPRIDFGIKTRKPEYNEGDIPCWSLAALLSVLQKAAYSIDEDADVVLDSYKTVEWHLGINNSDLRLITEPNLIDACYEMIIKLHELKKL